jgi:hypothetical protein
LSYKKNGRLMSHPETRNLWILSPYWMKPKLSYSSRNISRLGKTRQRVAMKVMQRVKPALSRQMILPQGTQESTEAPRMDGVTKALHISGS